MSFPILKILLSLALTLTVFTARAGHGEEAPKAAEGGGEAAKEGEGKGESKKDDYSESQARVAALQAKVHASEETIHKLIEEKQAEKNPEKVGEIVKELVKEHRTLQKNAEEFDQAKSYLQYRFPEKGLKDKRVYERMEVKSLEEMENAQSMDSKIKKTLGKVRKQYSAPEDRKKEAAAKAKAEAKTKDETESQSVRAKKKKEGPGISDPVIITK